MKQLIRFITLLLPTFGFAQACLIDWYKVAGGDGILLVVLNDASASKIRIPTTSGTKSLMKLP